MRTNKAWRLAAACIAIQAMSLTAYAQQPPQLENLEEGEAPAVTIRKPEQRGRIEEKRVPGGRVTEVQVTSGGSTYVVKPNDGTGGAYQGDLQSNTIRPPQWQVKEFDFVRSKTKEQEEAEAATPAPPEAPAKK
jgi:hypothetical protein